ncbi:hypothetical protein AAE478_008581 [Parahypoxylon ruwenzoriense]
MYDDYDHQPRDERDYYRRLLVEMNNEFALTSLRGKTLLGHLEEHLQGDREERILTVLAAPQPGEEIILPTDETRRPSIDMGIQTAPGITTEEMAHTETRCVVALRRLHMIAPLALQVGPGVGTT